MPGSPAAPAWADAATDPHARRARWRRQASLTTLVGVAARAVSVAVRLLMIPLALRLLGPERYGLWLSVGSLLAWLGFVGPGLGFGLINAVSEARGRDDTDTIRRHVSTAVFTLLAIGALLLMLSPLLPAIPELPALLGVTGRADLLDDTRALLMATAVLFALSFALEFVVPLCSGLQEGYLSSIAATAASFGILGGVIVLEIGGGTLVTFALVVGLPPILANLALALYVLRVRHPELWPSWRLFDRASFTTLLGFGGWMFMTQVGDMAIFQSANILIASHFGPGEVPRYAVPASVFLNVSSLCFLMVQPYWPALKEATVRGDWEFIRITTSRTLKMRMALMAAAATFIVAAGPPLIRAWAGEETVPNRTLLLTMSVYYLLMTLSGHYVVLLLSFGLVRLKALLTLFVGVSHIAGFLLMWPTIGLSAIPVAGALAVMIECLIVSRAVSRYMEEHAHA